MFKQIAALLRKKPVEPASITGLTQPDFPVKKKIVVKKATTRKVTVKPKVAAKKVAVKKSVKK